MKRTFLLAALCAAGLSPWALRAEGDQERSTLANRPRFYVIVEVLDDAQQCGLTEPQVQTDVELRLRRSGVVVDPRTERHGLLLYVNIHAHALTPKSEGAGLGCVYNISVEFHQLVKLLLDGRETLAPTWLTGMLGVTADTSGRQIRDALGDLVDRFLNDWLSVNPPKARTPGPNK
jgi:hypothetical protein